MGCPDVGLAVKHFIIHGATIYDTTFAYSRAGMQHIRTGGLWWLTAFAIGRTAWSCYKESATEGPREGDDPKPVAILPVDVALAGLTILWRSS